mgnify:CR=1 FL=1
MSEEELQALKDEVDALKNKNKELLTEVKKERNKNRELNLDDFNKLTEKVEQLESENSKLNGTIKLKDIEVQKLSTSFQEANGKLEGLSKNDAIAKLVDSIPISDPKKIPEVREILSDRATYKDGVLTIRGKDANEYITEWTAKGAFGYDFLAGTQHSGGGASGGGHTGGSDSSKYFDRNSKDFNLTEQARIYQENPTLYKQLKGN